MTIFLIAIIAGVAGVLLENLFHEISQKNRGI
jgi:hypothetical protein